MRLGSARYNRAYSSESGGGKPIMSDRESRVRSVLITNFPMFIATLSLCTAIFNGYLNNKFINLIQSNVGRVEYMKACKEIIDAYFQVKFRAALLNAQAARERANKEGAHSPSQEQIEADNAVNKVGALGTYLANLRDEPTRAHYTEFTNMLEKIVARAATIPPTEFEHQFDPADGIFTEMNDDCVKRAKNLPM
jgi:hypothetical protein